MTNRTDKEYYIEPTRYADGVYHIGTSKYPCWLIDCESELVLLDTAMPNDLDFILENIEKIGYNLKNVKHILHSHGHIDHFGCTKAIVEITGARTYIGKGDEDSAAGRNELQWTNEFDMKYEGAFEPDVIINDKDKIKIGSREFYFLSTPGHTRGTLSIFFDVTDEGKTYRAGMLGGVGFNTLESRYLKKYSIPLSIREDFKNALLRLYGEKVEVHLGNHLGNAKHHEKVKMLGQGKNPFIETETWKELLDMKLSAIEKLLSEEN